MPITIENRCNGCIECCNYMTFRFPGRQKDDFYDFYNQRGCEVKYADGVTWVVIPFVCPKLTETGCGNYEDRPGACMAFDGRNHPVAKEFCKIAPNQ